MKDTKVQSLLRGRIGAAILSLVAFMCVVFGVSPEDSNTATMMTNQIFDWIGGGSALIAGIMAFVSKLRE